MVEMNLSPCRLLACAGLLLLLVAAVFAETDAPLSPSRVNGESFEYRVTEALLQANRLASVRRSWTLGGQVGPYAGCQVTSVVRLDRSAEPDEELQSLHRFNVLSPDVYGQLRPLLVRRGCSFDRLSDGIMRLVFVFWQVEEVRRLLEPPVVQSSTQAAPTRSGSFMRRLSFTGRMANKSAATKDKEFYKNWFKMAVDLQQVGMDGGVFD